MAKTILLLFVLLFSILGNSEQVPNEFIVQLNSNKNLAFKTFFNSKSIGREILKSFDSGLYHIKLMPSDLNQFNGQLKNNIEFIEPNFVYRKLEGEGERIVFDTVIGKQWGLGAIEVGKAWEYTKGDSKVIVAVIDTGIDCLHDALKGRCLQGWNFLTNKAGGVDDQGHGTHCAGVINANYQEISGVAPNVNVLAIKILGKDGSGTLDKVLQAIKYAIINGAKIISNSWGGYGFSRSLYNAIKYGRDNGVLFVVAAGNEETDNDGEDPSYPASFDLENIISVGAVDKNFSLASFSNYGLRSVHVTAPGVDILSTYLNNKYASMSGTSMSTPFVAGLSALIISKYSDYSYQEIKETIMRTVQGVDALKDKTISGGVINASF
jgi:subtilisin family serine protease